MPGNGKVFISHTYEDNPRCIPLIAALDAWSVNYWFDTGQMETAPRLPPQTQKAIAERDIFIRVCTANTARSMSMRMESSAFRIAQAEDRRRRRNERLFINLILDPLYEREPFDNATLFIDGATRPRAAWLTDLGRALGRNPTARALNRRAFVALGAAVAVTVASAVATGVTLASERPQAASSVALDLSRTPFEPRWQVRVGKQGATPGVALQQSTLIAVGDFDSGHGTIALRSSNGQQLWSAPKVYNFNGVAPACGGGAVFVNGDDGSTSALDLETGEILWNAQNGNNGYSAPAYASNAVYVTSDTGILYARDARTGTPVWQKTFSYPASANSTVLFSPAISGGTVYAGSLDTAVYAFDAKSGALTWKHGTHGPIYSTPAVAGGAVYVGSSDNSVYALRATDGKLLWRFATGATITASPAVFDGVLYIGSEDRYLYALDAKSGAPYWAVPVGDKSADSTLVSHAGGGTSATPAVSVAARAIYLTAGGFLYGFSVRDGSRRGRFQTSSDEFSRISSPVVSDTLGLAFFGAADGNVYAINL